MIIKRHMWIVGAIFFIASTVLAIIWYYDIYISRLQIIAVLGMIFGSFGLVLFSFFAKRVRIKRRGKTMDAVKRIEEIYKDRYKEELKPIENTIQRRRFPVESDGRGGFIYNDFVALFAVVKRNGNKKVLIYNADDDDIWDVYDRPSGVAGKEVDLFDRFTPIRGLIPSEKRERPKNEYVPLGIPKNIGPFDTEVSEEKRK